MQCKVRGILRRIVVAVVWGGGDDQGRWIYESSGLPRKGSRPQFHSFFTGRTIIAEGDVAAANGAVEEMLLRRDPGDHARPAVRLTPVPRLCQRLRLPTACAGQGSGRQPGLRPPAESQG